MELPDPEAGDRLVNLIVEEVGDLELGEDLSGVSAPLEDGRDGSLLSVEADASELCEEPAVRVTETVGSSERLSLAASVASDNSPARSSKLGGLAAKPARPLLAKILSFRPSAVRRQASSLKQPRSEDERRKDSILLPLRRGVRLSLRRGDLETVEVVFVADETGFRWHGEEEEEESPHAFSEVVSVSAAFCDSHELRIVTVPETKAKKRMRKAASLDVAEPGASRSPSASRLCLVRERKGGGKKEKWYVTRRKKETREERNPAPASQAAAGASPAGGATHTRQSTPASVIDRDLSVSCFETG